jgi:dUTP pyrophosphatase
MSKEYVLRIKPLNDDVRKLYENQQKTHKGDAGVDLYNRKTVVIPAEPYDQYKIDFEIQCEVVKNYITLDQCGASCIEICDNVSYLLVPRSSIVKTPFRMSNSIGIIDAGYRGNIMAYVDKINNISGIIQENERLFQIVLPNLKPIDRIEIVDELSSSSRGTGGFGSTGKN